MGDRRAIRVANRPGTPVLVFDGDCGFCRRWVDCWRAMTGDRVAYRPYRDASADYPEIGEDRFRSATWLVEPDGTARGGAAAVFRLYELAGEASWPRRAYDAAPPLAAIAERAYDLVARNRSAADVATRWLWGRTVRRPRYRRMRGLFLRSLGVVYAIAFASLAVQVEGLIGSRGIAPAREYLDAIGPFLGASRYWDLPTLLWLDSSDATILGLCWAGAAGGLVLAAGLLPRLCLLGLWAAYLSLVVVGQPFLGYQWDALLLEAGLLGVLISPRGLRMGDDPREPSELAVGLVRWLLFRLMFTSGVVKLSSGDPAWRAWEALKYHYETQPLPTWTSWYVHQLPPWAHAASVGLVFWAELVVPFLVFAPRRPRMLAFWTFLLLQGLIAATGNYGFFNLLSAALCLCLVEDRDLGRRDATPGPPARPGRGSRLALGLAAAVILPVTAMQAVDRSGRVVVFPAPLESLRRAVGPLRSLNAYGLFAVMTTDRPEIVVEGSHDGETWTPYPFRWKPGDPSRRPRFATPHMPRLDWQMWFAALAPDCRSQPWFLAFERRLLEGSPPVLALLADDPFAGRPPRYVRARLELYRFTGRGSRDWWQATDAGPYCPTLGFGPERPR